MNKNVFVNRTLNLKKIGYIGFDMDHTLVRYKTENFEKLTHRFVLNRLVTNYGYPEEIKELPFEYDRVIRGLVLDLKNGNLLKLNQYSGIRVSYHGTHKIDYSKQKRLYKSIYIDLAEPNYVSVDTHFSVALALLFAQLVDLKEGKYQDKLPVFAQIGEDLIRCVDEVHRDWTLKDEVRKDLDTYICREPDVVFGLERLKKHGKKLFILTNSYYEYTKMLLDYAINPFLKDHDSWMDLFQVVITGAQKPRFFQDKLPMLRIDPETGMMMNEENDFTRGIFQGGCAETVTDALEISGEDILYLGDHIYGDVLIIKKDCNWRTGLVVDELTHEIATLKKSSPIDETIANLMKQKEPLEDEVLDIITRQKETGAEMDDERFQLLQNEISEIDTEISTNIIKHQEMFNPYWGEVMRIGNEESFLAGQIERYACIYMPNIADFMGISPRSYLRRPRRTLPHEMWPVEGI